MQSWHGHVGFFAFFFLSFLGVGGGGMGWGINFFFKHLIQFNPIQFNLVPENWIEVSVSVELRTVRIMTQGYSNLRPLWRDQQP